MAACRVLRAHGDVDREKGRTRTGATPSSKDHGNPQHPFLPLVFLSSFAPPLQLQKNVETIIKKVIPFFLHFHVNSHFQPLYAVCKIYK